MRRLRAFIGNRRILQPGPVVVAVSGGPDSVALLGSLNALSEDLGLALHVAHFDHRMRSGSEHDARFVERLATAFALPFHLGAAARPPKGEAQAREARYRWLRAVASDVGAAAIALGHTRDDQAETVLLNLARGSGIAGLAAMRPRRGDLARPLLCLSRQDTLALCAAMGVRPRQDPTNRDLRYARNLVRRRVLPALERAHPGARDAIARSADHAAALADLLDRLGREAAERAIVRRGADGIEVALERLPDDPLLRSTALALVADEAGVDEFTERHRRALESLAASRDGSASLDLGGGKVAAREYARLKIGERSSMPTAPPSRELTAGAPVEWGGWRFRVDGGGDEWPLRTAVPKAGALYVRGWQSGDRLVGGGKVQDVLTDAKVPRRLRLAYPVVVTRTGDVVWVPGLASARNAGAETVVSLGARPPEKAGA